MKKKILSILILSIILFSVCACGGGGSAATTTFTESDFSIDLPKDFEKGSYTGLDYYYESDYAMVSVLRESQAEFASYGYSDLSLEEYADLVLQANNMTGTELKKSGKYYSFPYTNTVEDTEYYYTAFMFKGGEYFFLVNCACFEKDKAKYADEFFTWADSIKVK